MNKIIKSFMQESYMLFYYRLFSNAIAIRRKDTILGSIYAKIMKWPEKVSLKDQKYDLLLPRTYAKIQVNEYANWEKWYGNNFKNKIVLDVGAGAGETASFFFNRGAKEVIVIENNLDAFRFLLRNRLVNNWNMKIIYSRFDVGFLELEHDYMKMDIEGGEIELLKYEGKLRPCSLEVHPERIGKEAVEQIIKKFNLKVIMKPRVYGI